MNLCGTGYRTRTGSFIHESGGNSYPIYLDIVVSGEDDWVRSRGPGPEIKDRWPDP